MIENFIPCKILNKKWADRLLDGEVFMRPLAEFGSWSNSSEVNDENRKDIMEGAVATFTNPDDYDFTRGLDPEFKKIIGAVTLIDQSDLQYFKVFCMYCLEVLNDKPLLPDEKLRGFGDTVVVFRDFNAFLIRFFRAVQEKYPDHVGLLDRVNYYKIGENRRLNPLFEKTSGLEYQKELRLAVCQSEKNKFYRGPDPDNAYAIILDKNKVTFNVGSIHDIAYTVPMEKFLQGKGFSGIHQYPMTGDVRVPYDFFVDNTKKEMSNYKSGYVSPMITIFGG